MYPLPASAVSIGSYFVAPLLFSRCRPQRRPLLSPLNWFFVLFGFQLVVTPLVVMAHGPFLDLLPSVPSVQAVNLALLLYAVAYWSFCCGVHLFRRRRRVVASTTDAQPQDSWTAPGWLIGVYFVLGVVGVLAFFGKPAQMVLYFLNPQEYLSTLEEGSGVTSASDAASTFLRAFFPFSILMLWCRATLSKAGIARVWAPLLLSLIAVTSPIYSYERSSLVVPLVSIGAIFTKRRSKASRWALAGLLSLMVGLLAVLTTIRLNPELPGAAQGPTAVDLYQGYGMAPQYLGFLLEQTHYARTQGFGRVTFASVVTPVPVIGKPFRESSGTAIFGQLTYRTDLPCPFVGELFLDFNVLGVIAGFLAVGFAVARLEDAFDTAREPLQIYVLQFAAIWFSYTVASSISVVSLAALYLSWPIYVFVLYRVLARHRHPAALRLLPLHTQIGRHGA